MFRRSLPAEIGASIVVAALLIAVPTPTHAAIFGLVNTGELYSSTNGGTTWTILATLSVSDAVGLVAGSSASELFLITRSGTVYKSTNAGTSWSAVGAITASDVASFTIHYDGAILALTESGTLYRSTNGGATFGAYAALTGSNFVSLTRGPMGRLYALTRTGEVYESQDQGATWTPVGRTTVSNAVAIQRSTARLYILTETGEVYRSLDFGRNWTAVAAITAPNMRALLDVGSTLVAAAETGEVYSSSSGTSWTAVGAINQLSVMSLGADTPLATGVADEQATPAFVARVPYPNPSTRVSGSRFAFVLPEPGRVRLTLFDVQGRRVAERRSDYFASAGIHTVDWKPGGVATGVYVVRISTDSGRATSVKWSLVE